MKRSRWNWFNDPIMRRWLVSEQPVRSNPVYVMVWSCS